MVEDVITLPLRLGASATRLGLRVAAGAVTRGLHATERLAGAVVPHDVEPPDVAERPPSTAGAQPAPRPGTPPVAPAEPAAASAWPVPAPVPAHVSREAELVEAFAEPGAEDGAGAAVHVAEPWKGYDQMTANAVIDRLAAVSREALAAVVLYERSRRGRRSVLAAADRRLREATAAAR